MASIIKSNSTLASGGIVLMRNSFTSSADGSGRYSAEYVCLRAFSSRWSRAFSKGAAPPLPISANILTAPLTQTPTLYEVESDTQNGLTYYRASYTAALSTEVTITEDAEVRTFTITTTRAVGFERTVAGTIGGRTEFVQTGEETTTETIPYISVTVTAQSKNTRLPNVQGSVRPAGSRYTGRLLRSYNVERTSTTVNSRGERIYSKSSSGVVDDIEQRGGRRTIKPPS